MVVLGQLGKGKSELVKTYLDRQLRAGRQAFVLDPKGEYATLADRHGLPRLRLAPGGPARLNPLDPPAADAVAAARRRTALLAALHTDPDRLAAALRPVALELHRLLAGDLAGMLDGPTTVALDPAGRGLVLDLSAVFGTDALAPVMVGAGAWLAAAIGTPGPRRRLLLVDEAWALLGSPATTSWLQAVSKLARRHGVQLITVLHRLSDLAAQADAGSAARAQAEGLLADAETRVVYAQSAGERELAVTLLGLSPAEADLVCRLPRHRALWLVGAHAAVVDHVLAAGDGPLVDTDAAMRA